MKLQIIIITVFIALLNSACDTRSYKQIKQNDNNNEKQPNKLLIKEELTPLSPNDTAVITHTATVNTSMGTFVIGLYGEDAPETVANFIGLSKMKYYNGVLFHRVAKNFLIQTGDRNTLFQNKKNEWGLGGESFYGGEIEDELNPKKPSYRQGYQKGIVAMANKGPNTNTSQFFICLEEAKKIERKYTIFGKVISGMNIVENISKLPVEKSNRGENDGIPLKTIRIYSIEIKLIKAPRIK